MQAIVTVTGVIEPREAGVTLAHEHVLCDLWDLFPSYNNVLDDEGLAIEELRLLREAGGRTLVDCTPVGLRRNPEGLRRISEASGIRIVMGSGWYREPVYPEYIRRLGPDDLAEMIVKDLTKGADGTTVRAGFIGEIGTERSNITAAQERVFRAAARAHRRTGATIWTHTTYFGELALNQIELLREEDVPATRIVISHLGDRFNFDHLRTIARTGVFLGIDNIGNPATEGYAPDDVHARNVAQLIDEGFLDQILLSTDICTKSRLAAYGGGGYGYLLNKFLPRLRQHDISEAHIRQVTVDNIARALTYDAAVDSR
jgi:predicted metal-dependent phosphotriesterase family hydrolase